MKSLIQLVVLLAIVAFATSAFAQITITHEPLRLYHNDTSAGYEVKAKITSTQGSINIRRVFYSVNGGGFSLLFMQPTGRPDEFGVDIPGQPNGSTIRYWILAADTGGNVAEEPSGAPGQGELAHTFQIGHYQVIFFDDFEGADPGWTTGADMGEDDWMIGAPNVGGGNVNDPTFAWSGSNVRGNDLLDGGIGQGDYPANSVNWLKSPTIDCSGRSRVLLNFRRWLTVEEGIYDDSIIYVNDVEVWRNQENGHTLDTEWKWIQVDITSQAANNPAVEVKFELTTDGGLEYGGWTIDDFQLTERVFTTVRLTLSSNTPSLGDDFVITCDAGPNEAWYFHASRRRGSGTYDVPSGPAGIFTGLDAAGMKQYASGVTDGAGRGTVTRRVPNRPNLIGATRWCSNVSNNGGWVHSNLQYLEVMP